jgi:outer membrane lipoprotein-sorting protein
MMVVKATAYLSERGGHADRRPGIADLAGRCVHRALPCHGANLPLNIAGQGGEMRSLFRSMLLFFAGAFANIACAQAPDGKAIVEHVEKLLWGKTLQGRFEMSVSTPSWQRTLKLQVWMERPDRSFIRIMAPAKEAGIGSLRIKSEMWNYLPSIERVIKLPPSMMLQPWMGSDFTNDDLVKESSIINDYSHRLLDTVTINNASAYRIEAVPKPDAAVVWGKIIFTVRQDNLIPLKEEFFSERGELARTMTFSDVRAIGGRTMPTRWEMRPTAKPGNVTTVVIEQALYDRPVDPDVFTQRNLQKR